MILYYLRIPSIINNIKFSEKIGYFNSFSWNNYIIITIILLSSSIFSSVPIIFAELQTSSSSMRNSQDINIFYKEANNFFYQQKYDEALQYYDKALAIE